MLLLPLFEDFIKQYPKYRARMRQGRFISQSVLNSYNAIYQNLVLFEAFMNAPLELPIQQGKSTREVNKANRKWAIFYKQYCKFLHSKGCLDNYVGHQIKIIRTFLSWTSKVRNITLGNYKDYLHQPKDEIPIVTLSLEHIAKLMDNKFQEALPFYLSKTANLLLFGCTVGLRYSDLECLNKRNIEKRDGVIYLVQRSKKTDTATRIRLPHYALEILKKYKGHTKQLLPYPSKNQFNLNLKKLGEAAGWVDEIGKFRSRGGKKIELRTIHAAQIPYSILSFRTAN